MSVSGGSRDSDRSQASDSPASQTTAIDSSGLPGQQSASGNAPLGTRYQPGGEEPDMVLELDLPSDGRDQVGEAMIRDLPQRPELSEPRGQLEKFRQPT